jgi:hypothetical protein
MRARRQADQALVASDGAASVSTLSGFDPSRKWRRGRVKLAFPDADGRSEWRTTDGYTDGTFVLDRRAYSKSFIQEAWGYVISHAATGYAICGVKGPLSKAKALVGQIRHLDWNFAEPEAMPPETRSAALPIMKAAGGAHVDEFLKGDWEPIASGTLPRENAKRSRAKPSGPAPKGDAQP